MLLEISIAIRILARRQGSSSKESKDVSIKKTIEKSTFFIKTFYLFDFTLPSNILQENQKPPQRVVLTI
jgi:hypothetical protein